MDAFDTGALLSLSLPVHRHAELRLLVVEASDKLLAHRANTTATPIPRTLVPAAVTDPLCSYDAYKRDMRCEGNALPGWSIAVSECGELMDQELERWCDEAEVDSGCGCLFGRGMPYPLCSCAIEN